MCRPCIINILNLIRKVEHFWNGDLLSRFKRVYIREDGKKERRNRGDENRFWRARSGWMWTVKRNQNNETSFVESVFPSRQASISFDREIASTRSADRTIWYRSFYATKHSRKRSQEEKRVVANRRSFAVRSCINYILTILPISILPFRRWINTVQLRSI